MSRTRMQMRNVTLARALAGVAIGGICACGGGDNPDPAAVSGTEVRTLSDDFDDPARLDQWARRHEIEGTDRQYTTLDVGTTMPGHLTIIPTRSGWFEDDDGPFLYKTVKGDFAVITQVNARKTDDSGAPPTQDFNSAGLMIRSPGSRGGNENWVMYNVGAQDGQVGTEGKTTVDGKSNLEIVPGDHEGQLIMCRVGDEIHLSRRLQGETDFTETNTYVRDDLPSTVQVGMVVNGFTAPPDIRAEFDFIRFALPDGVADCVASVTGV